MATPSVLSNPKHAAPVKRMRAKGFNDQQIEAVLQALGDAVVPPPGISPTIPFEDRFVREKECARTTGLSRVTRWRMEREGTFPRRRQLSTHTVGWLASEIDTWMRERIEKAERA